jgi:hypothetical protein
MHHGAGARMVWRVHGSIALRRTDAFELHQGKGRPFNDDDPIGR